MGKYFATLTIESKLTFAICTKRKKRKKKEKKRKKKKKKLNCQTLKKIVYRIERARLL
jgi:hypothetical protein